ncbi:IS200/IS605 family transposase [Oligoflexus sp.]|uniref:IS200/IS605 family transposase n=1 Tax=Oligoflexus sp. TaxID=1971216 RepID=UPI003BEF3CCD
MDFCQTCVYNIGYHIVWSTKYRRKVIEGAVETRLKSLFQEIARDFEFESKEMEVMPDHCHVFVSCHPKISPSDIVKCLKGITAGKLVQEFPVIRKKLWAGHLWNPSYYIGTVGNMSKDAVLRYIQNQKTEGAEK